MPGCLCRATLLTTRIGIPPRLRALREPRARSAEGMRALPPPPSLPTFPQDVPLSQGLCQGPREFAYQI